MKFKLLLASLAVTMAATSWAVPARRGLFTVTQPDGSTIQVQQVGDEFAHYTLNAAGDILVKDANGYYTYGKVDANGVQTPGVVRANIDPESVAARSVKQNISQLKTAKINAMARERRQAKPLGQMPKRAASRADNHAGMGNTGSSFPPVGDVRGLIILVEYSDYKFQTTNAGQYFTDMLNKDGFNQYGGTGCAAEYFRLCSNDAFRPVFDVLGPVTLPQKRSYYGGNDSYGNDKYPEMMVVHAVKALDATVDFSKYDMDNDGMIDNVFIFYAGMGEASGGSSDTVWPHAWDVRAGGQYLYADGKQFGQYGCTNEWNGSRPDGVGTFIHEFSHVLGLPDLYCTNYGAAESLTPGSYSALDYGPYNNNGRTPPIYSAFERNGMGWGEPIIIEEDQPNTITLGHIESSLDYCLIPTKTSTEFFLLENRQQKGWDTYIPGHGMLVWHIDFNTSAFNGNTVNNNSSHQYVDILEANGKANNQNASTMAGYPFPGTSKKTSLTSSTTPALVDWKSNAINAPITNIVEEDGKITFDVSGGGNRPDTPEPIANDDHSPSHFTAAWNPVDGADDYLLTVNAFSDVAETHHTTNFGTSTKASIPTGWTSSTTDAYTSSGNYGAASPSLKLATNGAYLQTADFDANVTSVKFWAKGNALSGSTLDVQGKVNGNWVNIQSVTPNNNSGQTFTVDPEKIPAGVRAIRFSYTKAVGNCALDDVDITTGGGSYTLEGYNEVSTNGATTMRVNTVPDINHYSYSVVAVAKGIRSKPSDPMDINMITLGVENIATDAAIDTDAPVQYFNLQGMPVRASEIQPGLYIRRQGSTTTKVIIK